MLFAQLLEGFPNQLVLPGLEDGGAGAERVGWGPMVLRISEFGSAGRDRADISLAVAPFNHEVAHDRKQPRPHVGFAVGRGKAEPKAEKGFARQLLGEASLANLGDGGGVDGEKALLVEPVERRFIAFSGCIQE